MKLRYLSLLAVIVFAGAISIGFLLNCGGSDSEGDKNQTEEDGGKKEEDGGVGDDDDDSAPDFEYKSCANTGGYIQYPNPNWEKPADFQTGVEIIPPEGDAATELLAANRDKWLARFIGIDGFPLVASFFISLKGSGASFDASKVKLFSLKESKVSQLLEGDKAFEGAIVEEGTSLMINAIRPLPTPEIGEKYILAIYDGAVEGAYPQPACESGKKTHPAYIDAANALVKEGYGEKLLFTLPFTASRKTAELKELYKSLTHTSVGAIEKIEEVEYASLGEIKPDDAALELIANKALRGVFKLPAYQGELGAFVIDKASGMPIKQGETKPGFIIALPKAVEAPYPVVLFQHGGGRFKQDFLAFVAPYAEKGMAVIGVDLPYHGDRSPYDGKNGSDRDMADFDEPLYSRDNFRQAASDHMAILTGVAALNDAIKPFTGLDKTLDENALFFVGHSMGALSGTITSSLTDKLKGASLIAGGAPYKQLLRSGLFSIMVVDIVKKLPDLEREVMLSLIQTLLDGGDPVNYPVRYESREGSPKAVMLWEAIGDRIVNEPSTDMTALEFGAELVKPYHHQVAGMMETDLPVSDNFGFADAPDKKGTRVLHQKVYDAENFEIHSAPYWELATHRSGAACFRELAEGKSCVFDYK